MADRLGSVQGKVEPAGAIHFVALMLACTRSTFTRNEQAYCSDNVYIRTFVQPSMPPLDPRVFSSYVLI